MSNFDNKVISEYISLMEKTKNLNFGSFAETKKLVMCSQEFIQEKILRCSESI